MTARVLLRSQQNLVIDATSLSEHRRKDWIRLAKEYDCPVTAYAHVTPLWMCLENNKSRERTVSDAVIKNQIQQYTIPKVEEGFQSVLLWTLEDGNITLVGQSSPYEGHEDDLYHKIAGTKLYVSEYGM